MAFSDKILTSIFGRRLGIQRLSTAEHGGRIPVEMLAGDVQGIRTPVTTAESTGTNILPYGVSFLPEGTSAVFTLDPPIRGIMKWIIGSTAGPAHVKTKNSETIVTSAGSSFTTVKVSSLGGVFGLVGLTSAIWGGINITTGTSSQASGFGVTTST